MNNPRNEKEILENIQLHRDKIKYFGKRIGNIDSWNDESFLNDMSYHVDKLYEGLELARMYYKHRKK